MPSKKAITIVGGGVAGLSLGIFLRRQGIPVCVWETGQYPRHRVCGELISGAGTRVLRALNVERALSAAGARVVQRVALFRDHSEFPPRLLPEPGVAVSRYTLDHLLAEEMIRWGGELRTGQRWPRDEEEPGVVWASGRRRQVTDAGWRLFGLKVHGRGATMAAELEMHMTPQGYVGLCQVEGERINVCGLFWARHPLPELAKRWPDYLGGAPKTRLRERWQQLAVDEDSFCSVAAMSCMSPAPAGAGRFAIGDAMMMIPPATGNGISVALESAALARVHLAGYSEGTQSWETALTGYRRAWNARFGRRFFYANRLQRLLVRPRLGGMLISALGRSARFWDWWFKRTR